VFSLVRAPDAGDELGLGEIVEAGSERESQSVLLLIAFGA
jgi:hypothetical protein